MSSSASSGPTRMTGPTMRTLARFLGFGSTASPRLSRHSFPSERSRVLGRDTTRSVSLATAFGAASSSCSYAAVAVARTLFLVEDELLLAQRLRAAAARLGIPVQCPSLGGLTGIGAVADVIHPHPDFVVLISVGEITPTQLDLLLSR